MNPVRNLFQSTVNRLTVWYVGVLFVVCIILSIPIYLVAYSRIESNAMRQTQIIQGIPGIRGLPDEIEQLRDMQIERDRRQLLQSLALINLGILGIGAYLSYIFAKRTLKPIEEAHEAQSRFTTDASHELRTPLAVMQAEIDVALRDKKLSLTTAKHVLESNLEEIERLRRLSEQLLNLTRLDGKSLDKKTVNFSKLVHEEIVHVQKQHELSITETLDKNIRVSGDENLLRELLKILLENARKYGQGKPVEVTLRQQDNAPLLTVTDHGIGIKASEKEHVFDRFYRGSTASKHSSDGHGLGLAIAKQIVSVHSGTISVSSQPSKHTTFTVQLV